MDIPLLIKKTLSKGPSSAQLVVHPEAQEILARHNWPGNVRELKNVIHRAMAFCSGQIIQPGDIEIIGEKTGFIPLDNPNNQGELVKAIQQALHQSGGSKDAAAQLLGMGRSTLFRKLKELRIEGFIN